MIVEIGLFLLLLLVIGWNIVFPKRFSDEEVLYLRPDPTTRELDEVILLAEDVADGRRRGMDRGGKVVVEVPIDVESRVDERVRYAVEWLERHGVAQGIYLVRREAGGDEGEGAA